jgi:hypothetical protein
VKGISGLTFTCSCYYLKSEANTENVKILLACKYFYILFFSGLLIKPKASCMLNKHFTTELYPKTLYYSIFNIVLLSEKLKGKRKYIILKNNIFRQLYWQNYF